MVRRFVVFLLIAALSAVLGAGCDFGDNQGSSGSAAPETGSHVSEAEPSTPPIIYDFPFDLPEIPIASAPGVFTAENEKAAIDYSNMHEGYVMARFNYDTGKDVRALVITPDSTQYQYRLTPGGGYSTLPLTGGNGEYTFGVWEHIEGSKYAQVVAATVNVVLDNEFVPFLRPNQFVNYNQYSTAVIKAAELASEISDPMEIISAVYNYVIANITYDTVLASTVESGYLPDIDAVLEKGMGICFDYSAVMAAMLRSQGIPTRMIFGYTGADYHAWISVYTEETGWIENIIHFNGVSWNLVDPTFAAGAFSSGVTDYTVDSSNYSARFMY